MKWETQDGRSLNIYDMSTNHIKNCINMLNRATNINPPSFQGEMAQFYSEQKYTQMMDYCEKNIQAFEAELKYREMGKPIGEKPFKTGVIESWEISNIKEDKII